MDDIKDNKLADKLPLSLHKADGKRMSKEELDGFVDFVKEQNSKWPKKKIIGCVYKEDNKKKVFLYEIIFKDGREEVMFEEKGVDGKGRVYNYSRSQMCSFPKEYLLDVIKKLSSWYMRAFSEHFEKGKSLYELPEGTKVPMIMTLKGKGKLFNDHCGCEVESDGE